MRKGEQLTDRELIRACIDRKHGAWKKFLQRYSALIYHIIWKTLRSNAQHMGHNSIEVEDICSDVLAQVVSNEFRLLRTFEWRCKFSTWLGIITYRTTRQVLHRNRRVSFSLEDHNGGEDNTLQLRDIIPDTEMQPSEKLELREAREMVHEALAGLPPRDQLVLKFFYFEGKKYAEIARILGISGSLVGTAIFRAKLRLAQKLQHDFLPETSR